MRPGDEAPAVPPDPVGDALVAIERKDWERLRPLLHPYVRWTTESGETVHGRTQVLAWLAEGAAPARPSSHELRDGQIYRWSEGTA